MEDVATTTTSIQKEGLNGPNAFAIHVTADYINSLVKVDNMKVEVVPYLTNDEKEAFIQYVGHRNIIFLGANHMDHALLRVISLYTIDYVLSKAPVGSLVLVLCSSYIEAVHCITRFPARRLRFIFHISQHDPMDKGRIEKGKIQAQSDYVWHANPLVQNLAAEYLATVNMKSKNVFILGNFSEIPRLAYSVCFSIDSLYGLNPNSIAEVIETHKIGATYLCGHWLPELFSVKSDTTVNNPYLNVDWKQSNGRCYMSHDGGSMAYEQTSETLKEWYFSSFTSRWCHKIHWQATLHTYGYVTLLLQPYDGIPLNHYTFFTWRKHMYRIFKVDKYFQTGEIEWFFVMKDKYRSLANQVWGTMKKEGSDASKIMMAFRSRQDATMVGPNILSPKWIMMGADDTDIINFVALHTSLSRRKTEDFFKEIGKYISQSSYMNSFFKRWFTWKKNMFFEWVDNFFGTSTDILKLIEDTIKIKNDVGPISHLLKAARDNTIGKIPSAIPRILYGGSSDSGSISDYYSKYRPLKLQQFENHSHAKMSDTFAKLLSDNDHLLIFGGEPGGMALGLAKFVNTVTCVVFGRNQECKLTEKYIKHQYFEKVSFLHVDVSYDIFEVMTQTKEVEQLIRKYYVDFSFSNYTAAIMDNYNYKDHLPWIFYKMLPTSQIPKICIKVYKPALEGNNCTEFIAQKMFKRRYSVEVARSGYCFPLSYEVYLIGTKKNRLNITGRYINTVKSDIAAVINSANNAWSQAKYIFYMYGPKEEEKSITIQSTSEQDITTNDDTSHFSDETLNSDSGTRMSDYSFKMNGDSGNNTNNSDTDSSQHYSKEESIQEDVSNLSDRMVFDQVEGWLTTTGEKVKNPKHKPQKEEPAECGGTFCKVGKPCFCSLFPQLDNSEYQTANSQADDEEQDSSQTEYKTVEASFESSVEEATIINNKVVPKKTPKPDPLEFSPDLPSPRKTEVIKEKKTKKNSQPENKPEPDKSESNDNETKFSKCFPDQRSKELFVDKWFSSIPDFVSDALQLNVEPALLERMKVAKPVIADFDLLSELMMLYRANQTKRYQHADIMADAVEVVPKEEEKPSDKSKTLLKAEKFILKNKFHDEAFDVPPNGECFWYVTSLIIFDIMSGKKALLKKLQVNGLITPAQEQSLIADGRVAEEEIIKFANFFGFTAFNEKTNVSPINGTKHALFYSDGHCVFLKNPHVPTVVAKPVDYHFNELQWHKITLQGNLANIEFIKIWARGAWKGEADFYEAHEAAKSNFETHAKSIKPDLSVAVYNGAPGVGKTTFMIRSIMHLWSIGYKRHQIMYVTTMKKLRDQFEDDLMAAANIEDKGVMRQMPIKTSIVAFSPPSEKSKNKRPNVPSNKIEYIFIDESGRMPVETLSALRAYHPRAKVILCGDVNQMQIDTDLFPGNNATCFRDWFKKNGIAEDKMLQSTTTYRFGPDTTHLINAAMGKNYNLKTCNLIPTNIAQLKPKQQLPDNSLKMAFSRADVSNAPDGKGFITVSSAQGMTTSSTILYISERSKDTLYNYKDALLVALSRHRHEILFIIDGNTNWRKLFKINSYGGNFYHESFREFQDLDRFDIMEMTGFVTDPRPTLFKHNVLEKNSDKGSTFHIMDLQDIFNQPTENNQNVSMEFCADEIPSKMQFRPFEIFEKELKLASETTMGKRHFVQNKKQALHTLMGRISQVRKSYRHQRERLPQGAAFVDWINQQVKEWFDFAIDADKYKAMLQMSFDAFDEEIASAFNEMLRVLKLSPTDEEMTVDKVLFQLRYHLKAQCKPKGFEAAYKNKEGQPVVAMTKDANLVYGLLIRVTVKLWKMCLSDKIILADDLSPEEVSKALEGVWEQVKIILMGDHKSFDATQTKYTEILCMFLFALFCPLPATLESYYMMKENLKLFSDIVVMIMFMSKFSGEKTTMHGNIMFSIWCTCILLDVKQIIKAKFVGDDSSCFMNVGKDEITYKMSTYMLIFDEMVKITLHPNVSQFCNNLYDETGYNYDPYIMAMKIINKNYTEVIKTKYNWDEYMDSFAPVKKVYIEDYYNTIKRTMKWYDMSFEHAARLVSILIEYMKLNFFEAPKALMLDTVLVSSVYGGDIATSTLTTNTSRQMSTLFTLMNGVTKQSPQTSNIMQQEKNFSIPSVDSPKVVVQCPSNPVFGSDSKAPYVPTQETGMPIENYPSSNSFPVISKSLSLVTNLKPKMRIPIFNLQAEHIKQQIASKYNVPKEAFYIKYKHFLVQGNDQVNLEDGDLIEVFFRGLGGNPKEHKNPKKEKKNKKHNHNSAKEEKKEVVKEMKEIGKADYGKAYKALHKTRGGLIGACCNSITLPRNSNPMRIQDGLQAKPTAVAKVFSLSNPKFDENREIISFLFPDLVRNRVDYDENSAHDPWAYKLYMEPFSDNTMATAAPSDVWAPRFAGGISEFVPIAFALPTLVYKPHGKMLGCERYMDKQFIWMQEGDALSIHTTVSAFTTNYSYKFALTKFVKGRAENSSYTISRSITGTGNFTDTFNIVGGDSGYYAIEIFSTADRLPTANSFSIDLSGNSAVFCHLMAPHVADNISSISSYRVNAAAILAKNIGAVVAKQGNIGFVQLDGSNYWTTFAEARVATITDLPGYEGGNAEDGGYAFIKPMELSDLKFQNSIVTTNGVLMRTSAPLVENRGFLIVGIAVETIENVQFQFETCVHAEYFTTNQFFNILKPSIDAEHFKDVVKIISGTKTYYENPLHFKEITNSIKNGLKKVIDFADYVAPTVKTVMQIAKAIV